MNFINSFIENFTTHLYT